MSKFNVIPKNGGDPKYSGTPTFTGTYMKPGMLEFREVSSPTPIEWVAGDYVIYSRTGRTYRLYNIPQTKKQSRRAQYGGAFVYQNVQFFDDSKQLEFCPFRDLVKGDNRIHFSTQPSISTFEGVDGLARRFEACLRDQYDVNGVQSWAVRIATASENPDLHELMLEPREFTVSGVNLLEALDKVYEIWPEVGWVYTIEGGKNTIVIGGAGLNANVGTYVYGKGNGLKSITQTAANTDELANRIFAYGSSRNMLPRWYNNQTIKDAESVDIQNLMIPVSEWGETNVNGTMLPDASKAFVEDGTSISRLGLRPTTVYFDGSGEYPEIYPSIRETTIKMVRDALGSSSAKYYPSTTVYTNQNARVDQILSAQASFDSGLAGDVAGKANVEMGNTPFSASGSFTMSAGTTYYPFYHYQGAWEPESSGIYTVAWKLDLSGRVQLDGIEKVVVSVRVKDPSYQGPTILSDDYELTPDETGVVTLKGKELFAEKVNVSLVTYNVFVDLSVYMTGQSTAKTATYVASGNVGVSLQNYRKKTFTISLRQLGFDIDEQSSLGEGKTIAMRSGKCAGRSFSIKSVQYNSTSDSWTLECWRSEDESLSQWFPNTDYPVRGLENAGQSNEYPGDEFVLLDIAMPSIYILMAEQKLYNAALDLLSDTAVERWQYSPEIDAKFMVENSRIIRSGEYMTISDVDLLGDSPIDILVDTITINEGEAAIPTYKVTLRDRKRKVWTESSSPTSISSKPISNSTKESMLDLSSRMGDSFFMLDESGNVTLKEQYSNLWVPGWLSAGGIGTGGSGGGGGLIETVYGVSDLGTPIATESFTETFSAKAIETIYEAVLALQQSTPNVSLVNGSGNSTLTVNSVTADFYTKSQVDNLIGGMVNFHYEFAASTSAVTNPQGNVLYLIGPTGSGADKYEEYVYSDSAWKKIGDTSIDLSGYLQISDVTVSSVLTSGTDLGTIGVHGTTTHIYGGLQIIDVEDNGTAAAGKWKARNSNISALTEGLTIRYKLTYAGATTTTLNLNGLGEKTVYRGGSTKLTTHYGVGSYILLYYSETLNDGSWLVYSDNDANTNYYERINSAYEARFIYSTSAPLYRYKICGYSKDGKIIPLTITNQTSATIVDKTPVSIGIEPNRGLVYYGTSTAKTTLTASLASLYNEMPMTLTTYTFNDNVPIYKDVYLKGTLGVDGLFYLDTTTHKSWYVFAPNLSTDGDYDSVFTDGAYYMFVGTSYSTENYLQLKYNNPVYRFIGGELVLLSELNYVAGTAVRKTAAQDVLLGVTAISNSLSSVSGSDTTRIEWDSQNGAWHFYGNLYADGWVAAGGIGSSSTSGGALADLADVSLSSGLANGDLLKYDGTHWVNIPQSSIVPTVSIGFSDLTSHPTTISGYGITDAKIQNGTITLGSNTITPLTSVPDLSNTYLSLANGGTVSGDVTFTGILYGGDGEETYWEIDNDGTASFDSIEAGAGTFSNLYLNGVEFVPGNYVTVDGAQTISGAKTFTATVTATGNVVVGGVVKVNGLNTIDQSNASMSLFNYEARGSKSFNAYGTSINLRVCNSSDSQVNLLAVNSDLIQVGSTIRPAYNSSGIDLGSSANDGGRWANIYGINEDLSGNLSVYGNHSVTGTLSVTGTTTLASALTLSGSTNAARRIYFGDSSHYLELDGYGFHFSHGVYSDSFMAAGGIGTSGGGGGYGVEEITTNQDGTVDFHFTGGDVTTVDLNHEHPQYPKYVLCANQAAYDAITTKESDTLYLIPETT